MGLDRVHADAVEVVDRGAEPDRLGDGHRPGLELPGDVVGREAVLAHVADHLAAAEERGHGLEELRAGPEGADGGRAEHLVAGDAHEVRVPLADVEAPVGGVLGGVDERERTGGVRGVGEGADVVDRAEHVRRGREREELRPREEAVQLRGVETEVVVERHPAQLDAPLGGQDVPRHHVGVVLELGEDDDVAGVEVGASPRVGDEVDGLGDVAGEHDLRRRLGRRGTWRAGPGRPRTPRWPPRRSSTRRGARWRTTRGRGHPWRRAPRRASASWTPSRGRRGVCRAPGASRSGSRPAPGRRRSSQWTPHAAASTSRRIPSKPSRSTRSAISEPPEATSRPSSRMWTRSGVRCSRMRR